MLSRALPAQVPPPSGRERLLARIREEPRSEEPAWASERTGSFARFDRHEQRLEQWAAVPAAAAAAPPPRDVEREAAPAAAPRPPARFRTYLRRHRAAVGGLAVAAVVLVAVGIGVEQNVGHQHKESVTRVSQQTILHPAVAVSPASGGSLQAFMFSGTDYPPGSRLSVSFVSPRGDVIPYRNATGGSDAVADATGTFSVAFTPAVVLTVQPVGKWAAHFKSDFGDDRVVNFTVRR